MNQRSLLAVLVAAGCLCTLAVVLVPRETTDQRDIRERISTRFSPGVAPAMLQLRRAIESKEDTPDDTLLRWFSRSQVGTDEERREAATLFLGLAIDWPADRVQRHRATLAHIAGELLANSNGDELVAWAGLAMACEVGSQTAVKGLADDINRSATSPAWKALYAEAFRK
jgi:hypothetical protein